jgi:hypothetical protein
VVATTLQLVRRGADGKAQLVLLDHGLYRQIDDDFRREYAALWRALIFADKQGIKRHAECMNAGEAYPLFAAMLTMRPWDQVRAGGQGGQGILLLLLLLLLVMMMMMSLVCCCHCQCRHF